MKSKVCKLDGCNKVVPPKNKKFCSAVCQRRNNLINAKKRPKRPLSKNTHCQECGKELTEYQREALNPKFCGSSCNAKASNRGKPCKNGGYNVTRNCPICKKDFVCGKSNPKNYCSQACANSRFKKYHTISQKRKQNKWRYKSHETANPKTINLIYTVRDTSEKLGARTGPKTNFGSIRSIRRPEYDIDHLKSGFHHEDNLQYLHWSDNEQIKSRYDRNNKEVPEKVEKQFRSISWQDWFKKYDVDYKSDKTIKEIIEASTYPKVKDWRRFLK